MDKSTPTRPAACRHQSGFTYLGLIILVSIIALAAIASIQLGAIVQRRAAEEQLLVIGREYVNALDSYRKATPDGQSALPPTLNALLADPRYPKGMRHLRKIYFDPLTGNTDWGIVWVPAATGTGKGIAGIFSLADGAPIKVANFAPWFHNFESQKTYHEWVFASLTPATGDAQSAAPAPNVPLPAPVKPPRPGTKF